jgi:hypothetical protein
MTGHTPDLAATLHRLQDEQEIRDLGHRFADACNQGDILAFTDLWDTDGLWVIEEPINVRAEGAEAIVATLVELIPDWDFFVQMPHAPVLRLDGDRATSTWTVSEHAGHVAGERGYFNYGRYDDALVRTAHGWRYSSRHYRYVYLDHTPIPAGTIPARHHRPTAD